MPNLGDMLRQAQALQAKMKTFQEDLEKQSFTGTSGGGAVTVTVNGKHEVQRVAISPEALKGADPQRLEGLVLEAVNDAARQVNEKLKAEIGKVTGGLGLPGMF